eukprot:g7829.t1
MLRAVAWRAVVPPSQVALSRNFHPIALLGGVLLKKWTVYKAASEYGWPRVYRRLLEKNREHVPPEHQAGVRMAVSAYIRTPTRVFGAVRDSPYVGALLQRLTADIASGASNNLPAPVVSLLKTVAQSTEAGKTLSELKKYAPPPSRNVPPLK